MSPAPARYLVVGATRILAPAVETLLRRGDDVVALARSVEDLARLAASFSDATGTLVPLAVDYTDDSALQVALSGVGRLDTALIYAPAAGETAYSCFRAAVAGPIVDLRTSAVAEGSFSLAELAPNVAPPVIQVVLGWHRDLRWHTPAEISAAALDAPSVGDRVLGVVRPWSDRPSH